MWIRRFAFLFLFLSFFTHELSAQENTYSSAEIEKLEDFAKYLENLGLLSESAQEYERLLHLDNSKIEYWSKLFELYTVQDQFYKIKERAANFAIKDVDLATQYIRMHLLSGYETEGHIYLKNNQSLFSRDTFQRLELESFLAARDWKNSKALYNSDRANFPSYNNLMSEVSKIRYKSPVFGTILSGIVPGLGRVYARDPLDGLFSFIFIAGNSIQSYRRFRADGINSVGGWVFGSIALGFYVSNLYGTYQSVKFYNNNIDARLHEKSLYHIRHSDL